MKRLWLGLAAVGSVWGHGAYVGPDWSADWLHREAPAQTPARLTKGHLIHV
jgi:nitric oxide reductase subunit B